MSLAAFSFLWLSLILVSVCVNLLQSFADTFYKTFNNRPFNSLEPEICHLVYVMKVEVVKESEVGYQLCSKYPMSNNTNKN